MTRKTSTTDLLAAARVAADRAPHDCRPSHLLKELDTRIRAGEPLPADWIIPVLPVEGGGVAGAANTHHRLANVLHAELMETELDYGGSFSCGPEHVSLNLEAVANRLARRVVEEVLRERQQIEALMQQRAVETLLLDAPNKALDADLRADLDRNMKEVRERWKDRS